MTGLSLQSFEQLGPGKYPGIGEFVSTLLKYC